MAHHSILKHDYVARVETTRDWLIGFFQEHPIFQTVVLEQYTVPSHQGIGIKLSLGKGTYANCYYVYESDEEKVSAHVTMIESDLGHATGFFLFHLHLVIAVMAGASEITLDNDTDNIQRARKGIYQLFKVNNRGMDQADKNRMTPASWAQKPEMVHIVKRTSLGRIQRVLLERIAKALEAIHATEVWRPDALEHLTLMFRKLRQRFDLFQGGMKKGHKTQRRRRTNGRKRVNRTVQKKA